MDKKTALFILIAVLGSLVVGYSYSQISSLQHVALQDSKLVINSEVKPIAYNGEDLYHFISQENSVPKKRINKEVSWYKSISADYPIGNAPGIKIVQETINSEVNNFDCLNDDENISEEEISKEGEWLRSSYVCSLLIDYFNTANGKLMTHILNKYTFAGGAHGIFEVDTITVDKLGKAYTFSDLVRKDYQGDYVPELIEIIKKAVRYQFEQEIGYPDVDSMREALTPEVISDVPFEMRVGEIVFVFTEAQRLSHATGIISISVPYSEMRTILNPDFVNL